MKDIDKVLKIAETLNNHLYANNIYLPVLEGFEIEHINNEPKCIFIAKDNDGLIEQLFIDEPLEENESLEERIKKVQNDTFNYIKNNRGEIFIKHLKNYNNGVFNFNIFIQDVLIKDKLIRQLDTFFIDEKNKNVYKLTLASGPFNKNSNIILLKDNNNTEDTITQNLNTLLKIILDNTKYNDKNIL